MSHIGTSLLAKKCHSKFVALADIAHSIHFIQKRFFTTRTWTNVSKQKQDCKIKFN